jgi:hypothetical protein
MRRCASWKAGAGNDMSSERPTSPTFSARRRFNCAVHAGLGTLAVCALVVMVNYLAARHSQRTFLSTRSGLRLAPQTLGLLRTLTNQINITVFYDPSEPYYSTVVGLLREYGLANPRIQIRVVDYLRDNAAAQQVFATYPLAGGTNKNLIIFDCHGAWITVPGNALMQTRIEVAEGKELQLERKPVAFYGEKLFTAALLAITSPKLKACAVVGHGEHDLGSTHEQQGYSKFAMLLAQYRIQAAPLPLDGTNAVPEDCNLLIVAGPVKPIPDAELEKIEQYLNQGGRLFALFKNLGTNSFGTPQQCGLERVLAKWGVEISTNAVTDLNHTTLEGRLRGYDLTTVDFTGHAAVKPLREAAIKNGAALHLIRPRAVERRAEALKTADAPTVAEVVRSAPTATLDGHARAWSLGVAVEKGAVPGVVTQRGNTRMIVVGDSWFLGNQMIESASNRDFAACAANWLLDRSQLLVGLGPRRVDEFRLTLSRAQVQRLQWLLLGGLPGAVLAVGGLIWLRRRS